MPLQSTVNVLLNLGVVGDIVLDEPSRIEPVTLATAGALGQFFTKANATGLASLGGTLAAGSVVFGGIAVNPKIEPLFGSSNVSPLTPNLNLQINSQVSLLTFGSCVIFVPNAWNIGDNVQFATATGVISTYSPSGAPGGGNLQIPNALMTRFASNVAGGALGIVRLTNPN
jgi:hypothetical protein